MQGIEDVTDKVEALKGEDAKKRARQKAFGIGMEWNGMNGVKFATHRDRSVDRLVGWVAL